MPATWLKLMAMSLIWKSSRKRAVLCQKCQDWLLHYQAMTCSIMPLIAIHQADQDLQCPLTVIGLPVLLDTEFTELLKSVLQLIQQMKRRLAVRHISLREARKRRQTSPAVVEGELHLKLLMQRVRMLIRFTPIPE